MGAKARIINKVQQTVIQPQRMQFDFDYKYYWNVFVESIPQFVSLSTAVTFILQSANFIIKLVIFSILVGQTIHILSPIQKRYINLRHLLIKWTLLLSIFLIRDIIKPHTVYNELFALMCNIFALVMVYPSKFLKNLHLTYFCTVQKRSHEEDPNNPLSQEMSLFTKILISTTILCLNCSRVLISFIDPVHRRRIEEAMRGVNMVIVEQKYFWKIYDQAWSNQNSANESQSNQAGNFKQNPKTVTEMKESIKNITKPGRGVFRAKVSEFIEILISTVASQGNRKFTFYRDVELIYNIDLSELTLVGEDGKSTTHILSELQVVDELMTELICEGQEEPVYLKFKTKKEMQNFMGSISFEA